MTVSPLPQQKGTSQATSRTARKARHAASPNVAFDEYFKEGEQKSKEEDFAPSAKAAPPPPPPKLGTAPPKAQSQHLATVEDEVDPGI